MKLLFKFIIVIPFTQLLCFGQIFFSDSFKNNLSAWEINNE